MVHYRDAKAGDAETALSQWESLKQREKNKQNRKSALDGIPHAMPALARAQKVLKKVKKSGFPLSLSVEAQNPAKEEDFGEQLLALVSEAQDKGFEAEHALKRALRQLEGRFREFEG